MSTKGEVRNERRKAAAWAWYQRGAIGSCAQPSGVLLKRRRRRNSFKNEDDAMAARSDIRLPLPSRFQREAAAAAHYDQYLHVFPPSPAASHDQLLSAPAALLRLNDDQPSDQYSHTVSAGMSTTHHVLQNPIFDLDLDLASCDCCLQSSTAVCRNCLPLHSSPNLYPLMPAALHHCAGYCDWMSLVPRRKSASSTSPVRTRWSDKLFGISSRNSFSSSQSSGDSLGSVCSSDHEQLDALISLAGSFCGEAANEDGATAAAAAAAFYSLDSRSSLLDSFELCAVLKKLGYYVEPQDLSLVEEQVLSSLEKETRPVLGDDRHDFSPPKGPCKQSLYDLLGWSERGIDEKGCSCTIPEEENCSSEDYYHVESPEINITSCSSSSCSANTASQQRQRRRRRRRPSILMPNLSQSFSNALHHMHLPNSFSNALHHLPHSVSNALHHLPQLPHSFSNALAHLTHSLSSAYRNRHVGSHRQNMTDEGIAPHPHINDMPPNSHNGDSAASPNHHTPHTHRYLLPSPLRHFLSFKWYHSPLHPSCDPAFDNGSPAAKCCTNNTPTVAEHHLKSSPSFDDHLYKSDDYMLIYSSGKKHSGYGTVHQHYHHHYHHYHYIF